MPGRVIWWRGEREGQLLSTIPGSVGVSRVSLGSIRRVGEVTTASHSWVRLSCLNNPEGRSPLLRDEQERLVSVMGRVAGPGDLTQWREGGTGTES